MKRFFLAALACLALISCDSDEHFSLSPLVSDGMVLQHSSEVTIWGFATPGTKVRLATDWGYSTSATTGPRNRWIMKFASLPIDNQKHKLYFSTSDTIIVVEDVMFGEVWLASGQSNMEMPLRGWGEDTVANAAGEIAAANDSLLRIFTVERNATTSSDYSNLKGKWFHATPENAPDFSATAYFFARNLRDSLQVPVGVVVSSWGGTPIESWIDRKTMETDSTLKKLTHDLDTMTRAAKNLESWLAKRQSVALVAAAGSDKYANISVDSSYVLNTHYEELQWRETHVPGYWRGEYDGVVWMVKRVVVPESWRRKNLLLCLGAIDDRDITYVNGKEVGRHMNDGEYSVERIYNIPANLVTDTLLHVVVRVTDTGGYGGIVGFRQSPKRNMVRIECPERSGSVSIEGEWKYAVAAEFYGDNMYVNDVSQNQFKSTNMPITRITEATPTALYVGMIEPVAQYKYRGVIWYQGETNVGAARQYFHSQQKLVECWRKTMGDDLGFYYVQIAPYAYSDCDSTESARLREAQRRAALKIEHCDMVTTIDIGSPLTIHPSNKQAVGERLAQKALYYDYGFSHIEHSGPVIRKVEQAGHLIAISFDHADGLWIDKSKRNLFEVAGSDGKFFAATCILSDDQLTLFSHHVPQPVHARYAGYNCVEASLFNGVGLPAAPFCTCDLQD